MIRNTGYAIIEFRFFPNRQIVYCRQFSGGFFYAFFAAFSDSLRVILINSGTYDASRKPAQYGRTGINAASYKDNYNDYAKVVSAVDRWTADPAVKCIAFQHIPLQELFHGDSVETKLLINSPDGFRSPNVCSDSGISGTYAGNSQNPTASGEYNEYSGCSYSSTRDLFNALADKPNVVGLFFGHDHMNTVTGRITVGGKSLVIGYGGALLVDPADYPDCTMYAYNPLISGYTLKGNGLRTQTISESKRLYTYYSLLRDYDIENFSKTDTYISEVRLFASDTSGMPDYPNAYYGYFEEARAKCVAAGFTPLETCYSRNTPGSAAYPTFADFNCGCYKYNSYYSDAKAVCLGYKTTNDPAKAITDIRIYDGDSEPPAKWSRQEIWAYQNNSQKSGGNRSTENDSDDSIPFYNANYDWNADYTVSTLRKDTNAQIKFCEGHDELGDDNNTWLFYTKSPQAGTPIKRIFADITDTDSFSGSFNLNRFNTEYPYTFAQNLHRTYDFDRDNAAFNVRMGYTGDFTGGAYPKAKGTWAYLGLVHAVEEKSAEPEPEMPEIILPDDSGIYIDEAREYIYGIPVGMRVDDFEELFNVSQDGYVSTLTSGRYAGTGSALTVHDSHGEAIKEYTVVIFGDLDGNGRVNGADISIAQQGLVGGFEDEVFEFAANIVKISKRDRFNAQDISALYKAITDESIDQTAMAQLYADSGW
ncbi:MAG: hypothetical protein K5756_05695 [Clostridiales bacterium]|nr:hypothetical protein [Clostridiales bacterium]